MPTGPLTSPSQNPSILRHMLIPTHLHPLQSHPMSAPRWPGLLAMRLCYSQHTVAIFPPHFKHVAHKGKWVLLVFPPATLYSRGRETHAREGTVTSRRWPGMCILLSQYLLFEESAVAKWGKSPAPADPTSCLGDPFTPYSWHLLPLPWGTSQATSSAPVPCAHRPLFRRVGGHPGSAGSWASFTHHLHEHWLSHPSRPKRQQGFRGPGRMGPRLCHRQ